MKVILLLCAAFIFSCSSKNQDRPEKRDKPNTFDSRGNYVGFKSEFVKIKKGNYMMGTTFISSFSDERPQHLVEIEKDFEVMRSELTQKMWLDIMGFNPSITVGKKMYRPKKNWKCRALPI